MEQHMVALGRANDIRLPRARMKKEVHAGIKSASDLVKDPPECLKTMRPEDLIRCLPHFQRQIAQSMVRDCEASLTRKLGELTKRQRLELGAMVADWEKGQAERVEKRERLAA